MASIAIVVRIYRIGLLLRVNLIWKELQGALKLGLGFEGWAGYRWGQEEFLGVCMC